MPNICSKSQYAITQVGWCWIMPYATIQYIFLYNTMSCISKSGAHKEQMKVYIKEESMIDR